jgi:hypothetical protein
MVAVRWYLRYGLSYRDIEELLAERGIEVDLVTVYRWVQRFTPLLADAAGLRHSVVSPSPVVEAPQSDRLVPLRNGLVFVQAHQMFIKHQIAQSPYLAFDLEIGPYRVPAHFHSGAEEAQHEILGNDSGHHEDAEVVVEEADLANTAPGDLRQT